MTSESYCGTCSETYTAGKSELPSYVAHQSELLSVARVDGMGSPWHVARTILGPDATDEAVHRAAVAVRDFAEAWGEKCIAIERRSVNRQT
jgi:hypothetical protein